MKQKKITALVVGAAIVGMVAFYTPVVGHAEGINHKAKVTQDNVKKETNFATKYNLANSGLKLQAVDLKTGKVIPTSKKEQAEAKASFAVTFHGYHYETQYNKYHLHQLRNQNSFHSIEQENLYNYLLNPNNRWNTEKEAMELHNDNGNDDCAYFVSTALRAVGVDIPYSTANCWTLQRNLEDSGWVKMYAFDQLEAGDICFAGTDGDAHTFVFMGWANKSNSVAWIADSQCFRFGNNMHVRGTFNYPGIDSTVFFFGGPGADIDNIGANTNGVPSHMGLKAFGVGVTTSYANVRSGPGEGYGVIGDFNDGTPVQILGETDGWYKVNYNGGIGYVNSNLVQGNTAKDPNNITIPYTSTQYPEIATGTINSYTWAMPNSNWNGNEITTFNEGQTVTITGYSEGSGQNGGWYRVNYQDGSVWVPAVVINTPIRGTQYSKIANGIIENPNNTYTWILGSINNWNNHIGNLNNGTKVAITGEKDGWYRINYMQTSAWVPKGRVNAYNIIGAGMVEFPSYGGSCITNGPSWNSGVQTLLPDNTILNVIGEKDGWFKVLMPNGNEGWLPRTRLVTDLNSNLMLGVGTSNVESNLRTAPNFEGTVVGTLPSGSYVNIKSQKDGWYEIYYGNNGNTAWIEGNRLDTSLNSNMKTIKTGIIDFNRGQFTSLAYGPSWKSDFAGTLNNGTKVQIVGECGPWYRINFGSSTAWVLKDRVQNYEVLGAGMLEFPSYGGSCITNGPSWSSGVQTLLPDNTILNVIGEKDGWFEVTIPSGGIGWLPRTRLVTDLNDNMMFAVGTINSSAKLLEKPSLKSETLGTIPLNSYVNIKAEKDGFYEIYYGNNESTAWIAKDKLTIDN